MRVKVFNERINARAQLLNTRRFSFLFRTHAHAHTQSISISFSHKHTLSHTGSAMRLRTQRDGVSSLEQVLGLFITK